MLEEPRSGMTGLPVSRLNELRSGDYGDAINEDEREALVAVLHAAQSLTVHEDQHAAPEIVWEYGERLRAALRRFDFTA